VLLSEVMRRTGLTRKQVRYLESQGFIGPAQRRDDRRVFSPQQVMALELIARLRELRVRLPEAAALAAEYAAGGTPGVPDERLEELLVRALAENERRARLAVELAELRRRRRGSLETGWDQLSNGRA
jgi:DNA-binding transcriptional MerR regulator